MFAMSSVRRHHVSHQWASARCQWTASSCQWIKSSPVSMAFLRSLPLNRQIASSALSQSSRSSHQSSSSPVPPDDTSRHADIDKQELKAMLAMKEHRPFTLLDVREPQETAQGVIDDCAVLVPLGELEHKIRSKNHALPFPMDQTIIVYCRSGMRAERAAQFLRKSGDFVSVRNYRGSWLDWAANDGA